MTVILKHEVKLTVAQSLTYTFTTRTGPVTVSVLIKHTAGDLLQSAS